MNRREENSRKRTSGWRLRVKAGLLAFAFAAFTLLPWLHVLFSENHGGCACSPSVLAVPAQPSSAPAVAAEHVGAVHSCWVCQSLVSLLQHAASSRTSTVCVARPSTDFFAHATETRAASYIYPASRSQAPPAHI